MAGFEKNQERVAALNALGKDLARRAKSKCELCEAAGVKLNAYEVSPVPKWPDFEKIIMVCDECHVPVLHPKRFEPSERWRVLTTAVWGELPVVQVVATRLLHQLAKTEDWAREAIEQVYLDPEVEAWVDSE